MEEHIKRAHQIALGHLDVVRPIADHFVATGDGQGDWPHARAREHIDHRAPHAGVIGDQRRFACQGHPSHQVTGSRDNRRVPGSQRIALKVPKRDLVSTLDVLFQSERLRIAEDLEAAPIFVNELLNFRRKVDLKTAHDSYEAWRESIHDDLVLAVAMACWYGEHPPLSRKLVLHRPGVLR